MAGELKTILDFQSLQIKLASPEEIRSWSHGEVTKPETINYRTLRPEKDGLFDERIFGPTKDYECYCGKYRRIRYKGIICDKCGVEVTQSRVRRERMGHIILAAPVAHIWFFKGAPPSKMALLLDMTPRALEQVIYFAQYVVTEVNEGEKAKALAKIEKAKDERTKALREEAGEKISANKVEAEDQKKDVKGRIGNKDAVSLAVQEVALKQRQREQAIRDDLVSSLDQTEEIFKRLIEIVKNLKIQSLLSEEEFNRLADYEAGDFFEVDMGAEAIVGLLKQINIDKLADQLRKEVADSTGQHRIKATKRLRVVDGMRRAGVKPEWMVLKVLPVIPPDLRPMVQLSGGRFATSDLNDLYRRVINRNNRLKHLMELGAPGIILRNEKRMLQEAVDSLIDASARTSTTRRRANIQPLRSLSDMLRGKQGRFRQNLLGKRVDYSGRSVIVVGPDLNLNQCGIPKEMALEMFKPFVLREMIVRGLAPNVKSAKNLLDRRPPEVFDILEDITHDHPVLLNRAPTLHKLSIQAFYPILIEGNAIRIHPCVCTGFNADFDGDQMAVHVPLSQKAQDEAARLMLPEKNLLRPADGSPVAIPASKEMALGVYYLTSQDQELTTPTTIFGGHDEAILAYQSKKIGLRQKIKMFRDRKILETTVGRILFNETLPEALKFYNDTVSSSVLKGLFAKAFRICTAAEVVEMIDKVKNLGFEMGTVSGISFTFTDLEVLPDKNALIKESNDRVAEIEQNYRQGLITASERKRLVQELWIGVTEDLADKTWQLYSQSNVVRLIIDAKIGRVSRDTIKQLSAMRGLFVDPTGKIVDLPTKSNFKQGLSIFEYVTSARGGRKGLTDTAMKTADAGYLTRRLVDVAHDMIVRDTDCGTDEGIVISQEGKRAKVFSLRVFGRYLAADIIDPKSKKTLLAKGTVLSEDNMSILDDKQITEVTVRSPLSCRSRYGVCSVCYGTDLSTKKQVEIGTPVGVIAAQSIGEPGTQLTINAKRTAFIIGLDVTQGLPRVEELFEARTPKTLSPLAEVSGKAEVTETDEGYKVNIKSVGVKPPEEREYIIPLTSQLLVKDGDHVFAGAQMTSGALDIKEVLAIRGLRAAQEYLCEEIQAVYESQGIPIHDKHFEVIIRKMADKVRVSSQGDTELLPGEFVAKLRFEEENGRVLSQGGEPATAQQVILGITRASLYTTSWLSAASFEQTTNVLTEASLNGDEDRLVGLKENVIIGRLIPVTPDRVRYGLIEPTGASTTLLTDEKASLKS